MVRAAVVCALQDENRWGPAQRKWSLGEGSAAQSGFSCGRSLLPGCKAAFHGNSVHTSQKARLLPAGLVIKAEPQD